MSLMEWLFGSSKPHPTKHKDPVKEVEEQPNVKEARTQINRANVILELDHTEQVALGLRNRRTNDAHH